MTTDHPDFDASRTIAALGDTIERLTRERDEASAEVERLREAAENLVGVYGDGGCDENDMERAVLKMEAALRGEEWKT